MNAKPKPPPNPDYYLAGRDRAGDIRMNKGRGALVALAEHTRHQVQDWFETSRPGQYREQYRAALVLLEQESRTDG